MNVSFVDQNVLNAIVAIVDLIGVCVTAHLADEMVEMLRINQIEQIEIEHFTEGDCFQLDAHVKLKRSGVVQNENRAKNVHRKEKDKQKYKEIL